MPRNKNVIPTTRVEIRLPEPLKLEVELFLPRDIRSGRVGYGEWSAYVEGLIRRDLLARAQSGE